MIVFNVCKQELSIFRPRHIKIGYISSLFAFWGVVFLLVAFSASSLELWEDGYPDIPHGAKTVSVYRSVSHGDAFASRDQRCLLRRITRRSADTVTMDLFDPDGEYLWTTTFVHEDDLLRSIQAFDGDVTKWRMVFWYDDAGRPVQESYFGADGNAERTIVYEYGDQITEVVSFRGDGAVAWRRRETDGEGATTRDTTYFYADGSRVKTIIADLDADGRPVSERHLDELGAVYRTIRREYAGGTLVQETARNEGGVLIRRTRWTYSDQGRMVLRTIELPAEELVEALHVETAENERGHWASRLLTTEVRYDTGNRSVVQRELLEREVEYE